MFVASCRSCLALAVLFDHFVTFNAGLRDTNFLGSSGLSLAYSPRQLREVPSSR